LVRRYWAGFPPARSQQKVSEWNVLKIAGNCLQGFEMG
jgi:hypothetical protein